jgi:effector-binding domain-containing protein
MKRAFAVVLSTAWLIVPYTTARCGEPAPPAIELTRIPAADVVYKVHRGPYWRLGKVYAEIGAIVEAHADAGPIFGRYLDDPTKVGASKLRTEVGFFVRGDMELPPGYHRRTLPAHEAATLLVKGAHAMAPQHHKRILQWIAAQGFTASGEIMEVYPQPSGNGPITEIRVPVEPARPAATPSGPKIEAVTLQELLETGAYARAAALVIPDRERLAPGHRKWVADVADRLRVIRTIVDSKYPDQARNVRELITPIVDRAGWFRGEGRRSNARSEPRASFAARHLAKAKSDILQTLDRLMVRAHLKSLAAEQIFAELVGILTDVERIVRSDGAAAAVDEMDANRQ